MYVQHLGAAVECSQLELKGFQRVHIDPSVEKDVVLDLVSCGPGLRKAGWCAFAKTIYLLK